MRVVKIPVQMHQTPVPPTRKRRRGIWLPLAVVAILVAQLSRPLPAPSVKLIIPSVTAAENTQLAMPDYGQSAVAAKGYGMLETHGSQTQLSTASIAKVITALCVLERKPLRIGEKGPMITMTRADIDFFKAEVEQNGSRVDVYEGQKMSEYQAIQALMIPSANNIANTLAVWAFGSLDAYQTYANNFVMRQGLVNTRIGSDASGYDPSTASSASDLVRLGMLAESNPVLLEIATQRQATFPLSGTMTNYNSILGDYGITGLKTGNNEQNPGAFLMTGAFSVGTKNIQFSGTVMGASSLSEALASSRALAASLPDNFEKRVIATSDRAVARYTTRWGSTGELYPTRPETSLVRWKGDTIELSLQEAQRDKNGKYSAYLDIRSGSLVTTTPIQTARPVAGPSLVWRLTRI